MYYKITNERENHHGFQYYDGLNVLKKKFNNFFDYGIYLRPVILLNNDTSLKIVKDHDKLRANKIFLLECMELFSINTYYFLLGQTKNTIQFSANFLSQMLNNLSKNIISDTPQISNLIKTIFFQHSNIFSKNVDLTL